MQNENEKVSYVVTVYNKTQFIPDMIKGLEAQEGSFEKEYIFIDDGSTDESVSLLKKLTYHWPNVHIETGENTGPSRALNKGFRLATGNYIKALDGDDRLTSWATSHLLTAIKKTDCALAYGLQSLMGTPPRPLETQDIQIFSDPLYNSLTNAQLTPSMWLAKKELIDKVGGCDPNIFVQDYSIEIRMAHRSSFAFIPCDVFQAPVARDGRLSENVAQTLHDVNLALMNFIDEHPDLENRYRSLAWKRASGRAWKWARREAKKSYYSKEFLAYLQSRSRLYKVSYERLKQCCDIYQQTHPIRIPTPYL